MPETHSDIETPQGLPPQINFPRLALTVHAITCLAAGVGIALLALAGPVLVWLELSDFRQGFDFLRFVNAWALWVAGATLVMAVFIAMMIRMQSELGGYGLAGLALIGSISAGLAWYVPGTFRPPEGTPPIHDIATDPYRPLSFDAIAPLRADAPNSMEYGAGDNMTPERLIELTREAYPDIVPQRFDESAETVFNRALAAAESLGWEIVEADAGQGRIEATDTTFWFRFKDDIVIHITGEGDQSVLNARSLSRVGISDVGKNAARLREFFSLLRTAG